MIQVGQLQKNTDITHSEQSSVYIIIQGALLHLWLHSPIWQEHREGPAYLNGDEVQQIVSFAQGMPVDSDV